MNLVSMFGEAMMSGTVGGLGHEMRDCLSAAGFVGFWVHDTMTDRVVADLSVARLFGVVQSDPLGDPMEWYIDGIHPADRTGFINKVIAASQTGSPFTARYRVAVGETMRWVHDYGSFSVDANGRPVRGQGIIIDVSRTQPDVEATSDFAMLTSAESRPELRLNQFADHVIAASRIARALPSPRLRMLTDPVLWEVGRLLGRATAKFRQM